MPGVSPLSVTPPPFRKGKGTLMLEQARAAGRPVTPTMEKMAKWMDDMEAEAMGGDGMPMLKPGDASMASPFTAKASGVLPCCDIIKQGRCTLVTTVQVGRAVGWSMAIVLGFNITV